MAFEICSGVRHDGIGGGMGFVEGVGCKARQLVKYLGSDTAVDAVTYRTLDECGARSGYRRFHL